MTGCRYGAKNTLVKNYLGLAESAGAQVHPMTTVTGFEQRADGVWDVHTARTGRWLWEMGRMANGLATADLKGDAIAPFIEGVASGFGPLRAVRHAAQLSRTEALWSRPAVPLVRFGWEVGPRGLSVSGEPFVSTARPGRPWVADRAFCRPGPVEVVREVAGRAGSSLGVGRWGRWGRRWGR